MSGFIDCSNINDIREFITHDNGSRPFKVTVNRDNIYVQNDASELVASINYFMGYWPTETNILVKLLENEYMYIGEIVYRFKTDDIIIDYRAPVGRNDVVYAVAFGEQNVYFMFDRTAIPKDQMVTPVAAENAYVLYQEFHGNVAPNTPKEGVFHF